MDHIEALRDYLTAHPELSGKDEEITDALNARRLTMEPAGRAPVDTAIVRTATRRIGLATGLPLWSKLDLTAIGQGALAADPEAVALARLVNDWLREDPVTNLDDPDVRRLLDLLMVKRFITAEERDALVALGDVPERVVSDKPGFWYDLILGVPDAPNTCSAADVAAARN